MGLKRLLRQSLEQKQLWEFENRKKPKKSTVASHRRDTRYVQIIDAQSALTKKQKKY